MDAKKIRKHAENYGLKTFKLVDLTTSINLSNKDLKEGFEDLPNSVYLPTIGNSSAISSLSELKIKPQNYAQLVFDPSKTNAGYVARLFNGTLGFLIRRTLLSGKIIPKVTKSNLLEAEIYLPELREQESISKLKLDMEEIIDQLDIINKNLSLFGPSALETRDQVDYMKKHLNLATSDSIVRLIAEGESIGLEFKSTMRNDIKDGTKARHIKFSILKTIVAYLNSEGGILLVGVSDDGKINGLEIDNFKNNDDAFLYFNNIFKEYISLGFLPYVDYDIIETKGKKIFRVECKPSDKPVFLKNENGKKEFFVRSGSSSDSLDGEDLLGFIEKRFGTR
jgi:hypothetical protein